MGRAAKYQKYRMIREGTDDAYFKAKVVHDVILHSVPKEGGAFSLSVDRNHVVMSGPVEKITPIETGFELKTKNSIYKFFR